MFSNIQNKAKFYKLLGTLDFSNPTRFGSRKYYSNANLIVKKILKYSYYY